MPALQALVAPAARAQLHCPRSLPRRQAVLARALTPEATAESSAGRAAAAADARSAAIAGIAAPHGSPRAAAHLASDDRRAWVMNDTLEFLRSDLRRLFDTADGRITTARYSPAMRFSDPVSQHTGLEAYVSMLRLLRATFDIDFKLLGMGITGADQISTRWSMKMVMWALPFRPTLVITGTSLYTVDPDTGVILSHTDTWDALSNNTYLSIEALVFVLRQVLRVEVTPALETPRYSVLKATADYELRQYEPYTVAAVPMGQDAGPAGGNGFTELAGFIFGGNAQRAKMEMTTPVFTTSSPSMGSAGESTMRFVMEERFADTELLPRPNNDRISLQRTAGGHWCARRFSGWPLDFEVVAAEAALRSAMLRDGLRPKAGYQLARYNDPATLPAVRRNEVLIEVEADGDLQLSL